MSHDYAEALELAEADVDVLDTAITSALAAGDAAGVIPLLDARVRYRELRDAALRSLEANTDYRRHQLERTAEALTAAGVPFEVSASSLVLVRQDKPGVRVAAIAVDGLMEAVAALHRAGVSVRFEPRTSGGDS